MRMPTRPKCGEGRVNGEVIDKSTRSIRRGNGHSTLKGDASAYGYRPRRGASDAIKEVHRLLCRCYTDVVDADLSKYFDTIPHAELLRCVARRIVDGEVLRLIKLWLKTPIEERDADGKRRLTGGKRSRCGTPQGGVVSPLLANLYMNRFRDCPAEC